MIAVRGCGLIVTVLVLAPAAAHALDASEAGRARDQHRAGQAAYEEGRFREAAAHFSAGYALLPQPAFLFNEAQAWRRDWEATGERAAAQRALVLFRDFLARADVNDSDRAGAQAHVAELERALTSRRRRKGLWIGLSVGAALAVGLALGLGVGLGTGGAPDGPPRVIARW
jgi:hypothetical protein